MKQKAGPPPRTAGCSHHQSTVRVLRDESGGEKQGQMVKAVVCHAKGLVCHLGGSDVP